MHCYLEATHNNQEKKYSFHTESILWLMKNRVAHPPDQLLSTKKSNATCCHEVIAASDHPAGGMIDCQSWLSKPLI